MSTTKKYRKKPVVIEAMHFGYVAHKTLLQFCPSARIVWKDNGESVSHLVIPTLEGEMRANVGDWIIRGVQGEFYPCKPDIFEQTYEEAS